MSIYKVSGCDINRVRHHTWHRTRTGYIRTNIGNRKVLMHVLIMGKVDGMVIDHINGDRSDNRRENLRHVTHSDNSQKKRKADCSRRFIGVERKGSIYTARARAEGKNLYIGSYPSERLAACAYDVAVMSRRGVLAMTNHG